MVSLIPGLKVLNSSHILPRWPRGGVSMCNDPLVLANLDIAAPNEPESSIWFIAATSDMWMCLTSFHDQMLDSRGPSPMILVGFIGLSGFLMYITPTLVTSSFSTTSLAFVIRNL